MTNSSVSAALRNQREMWLRTIGVPLPAVPVPPSADELNVAQLREADRAFLDAWDARDAEIDRIYEIAKRDAEGPSVPAVQGDL